MLMCMLTERPEGREGANIVGKEIQLLALQTYRVFEYLPVIRPTG